MTEFERALNRLCKWRAVFAQRWLGTRPPDDPEAIAVRDVAEQYLVLRVEVSALTALLIERQVCTKDQIEAQIIRECQHLQRGLEGTFPGFKATDRGMLVDVTQAEQTTQDWPP